MTESEIVVFFCFLFFFVFFCFFCLFFLYGSGLWLTTIYREENYNPGPDTYICSDHYFGSNFSFSFTLFQLELKKEKEKGKKRRRMVRDSL